MTAPIRATADVERFEEAIGWFSRRFPMTTAVRDELGLWALDRAWWVAGAQHLDVVLAAHAEIQNAIELGTPPHELVKRLERILPNLSEARLETVARTNLATSFNAGRWQQLTDPDILELRPYWQFDAIVDGRTTDGCRDLDGVTLKADDPFWLSNYPPRHHRCRSQIRAIRPKQYERLPDDKTRLPDEYQRTAPGFGLPPSLERPWRPDPNRIPPDLREVYLAKEQAENQQRADAARAAEERRQAIETEVRERPFSVADLADLPATKAADVLVLDDAEEALGARSEAESAALARELNESETASVKAFSRGYDATIRRLQLGASAAELFIWRRQHVAANGYDETEEQTRQHIRDAKRYAADVTVLLERLRGRLSAVRYVYRGIGGLTGEDVRRLLEGGIFDLRGQTSSTSWQPMVADGFERDNAKAGRFGVIFKLRTRSGVAIETISETTVERELLLRGDARFKVTRVTRYDRVGQAPGDDAGTILVEAEEIEP